jgi:hypothetical protein
MAHLKKLTLFDLATRLSGDDELKQRLALAVMPLVSGAPSPELAEQLVSAMDGALREVTGSLRVSYHIACASCGLNDLVQVEDCRASAVRIECCCCGGEATVAMPERDLAVRCVHCGVETKIKRVDDRA